MTYFPLRVKIQYEEMTVSWSLQNKKITKVIDDVFIRKPYELPKKINITSVNGDTA